MADERDDVLDLEDIDSSIEKQNKVEKRIKDLSEKVRLTAEERDEQIRLSKERDDKITNLEKERDFLSSFGDMAGKYPDAVALKEKVKEKVLKGYSVEDATIATLVSEGKYNPQIKEVPPENPAGGSAAVTQPNLGGEKPVSEMTRDEKRAKLIEAEKRGDLSMS